MCAASAVAAKLSSGRGAAAEAPDAGLLRADTGRIVQLIALLTVLSLAPSILVVMTSFTRIIVVLSLLRSALGTQSAPPNTVLVSLALFLTFFVMQPTLQRSYDNGIRPLIENQIDDQTAFKRSIAPLHQFMMEHVRRTDLDLFMSMGKVAPVANPAAVPLRASKVDSCPNIHLGLP